MKTGMRKRAGKSAVFLFQRDIETPAPNTVAFAVAAQ